MSPVRLSPRSPSFLLRLAALGSVLGALAAVCVPSPAAAQAPPDFQSYPLRDRLLGPGGAVFPNYVTPSLPGIAYLTGTTGGPRGMVFGTATADMLCQASQWPVIQVLSAPPKARVSVEPGTFTATRTDAGSTYCLGRPVSGVVVRYAGPVPKGGATLTLRVTYPPLGAWYDHVVRVPAR